MPEYSALAVGKSGVPGRFNGFFNGKILVVARQYFHGDEAERYMTYEAGFKTFSEMKIILMVAAVAAMMGELFLGRGLMAAVLLILCNMMTAILYTIHSVGIKKRTV